MTNSNATSEPKFYNGKPTSCPYGECDGTEIVYTKDENGHLSARQCRCLQVRLIKKKLKFAGIPKEFESLSIKSFNTDIYSTEERRKTAGNIKKLAIMYVKQFDEMKRQGKGLYLYSEAVGSGKTRLAISIGNALMSQYGTPVKFVTTLNLLDEIKSTWNHNERHSNDQTQSELLAAIKDIDVLILDDIGTEKPSAWVNEMFYNILNDRMTANKVTIFTSNCRIEELRHDSRIMNRIMKMAVPLKFPDESVRTFISKRENEEIIRHFMGG